jgi:hypothetical protein
MEIVSSVITPSGTGRSASTQIGSGQEAAASVANEVIDSVDNILDALRNEGEDSLNAALSAISSLGEFSPAQVVANYAPPAFVAPTFVVPNPLAGNVLSVQVTTPENFSLTGSITPVELPTIEATAPEAFSFTLDTPTLGALPVMPAEPVVPQLVEPEVPDVQAAELTLDDLVLPEVPAIELGDLALPTLPSLTLQALPTEPGQFADQFSFQIQDYNDEKYSQWLDTLYVVDASARAENDNLPASASLQFETIHDAVSSRELADAVSAFTSRGQEMPDDLKESLQSYARGRNVLMGRLDAHHQALVSSKDKTWWATYWLEKWLAHSLKKVEYKLQIEDLKFEVLQFEVDFRRKVMGTFMALFEARIALFNAQFAHYKAQIREALNALETRKLEIELLMGKARVNSQLAQNYATLMQAVTAKAKIYQAQVQAVLLNADKYKIMVDAVQTRADLARAAIQIYNGKVAAYETSVDSFKSQFKAYAVSVQGTEVRNRLEQSRVQVGMAAMQAAGANSAKASMAMEVQAEQLKLEAIKEGSQYENKRFTNIVEALRAQIYGDVGRQQIAEWSANTQLTTVKNDAIADNAQAAARYYENVSNSAYRAADQAFRAVVSSTQAAAVAQEAAGRSAASVAQGAYSAVHVSASISGAGRISASEDRSDRASISFSDMLNYSEERIQTLSA